MLGKFGAFLLSSKPASEQNFEAQIESGSIADMGLVLFENSPMTVTRTALHIAHSESDSLFVCQQVRGSVAIEQNGRRLGAWTALVLYGSDR